MHIMCALKVLEWQIVSETISSLKKFDTKMVKLKNKLLVSNT